MKIDIKVNGMKLIGEPITAQNESVKGSVHSKTGKAKGMPIGRSKFATRSRGKLSDLSKSPRTLGGVSFKDLKNEGGKDGGNNYNEASNALNQT